jgi:hypothetical protein
VMVSEIRPLTCIFLAQRHRDKLRVFQAKFRHTVERSQWRWTRFLIDPRHSFGSFSQLLIASERICQNEYMHNYTFKNMKKTHTRCY